MDLATAPQVVGSLESSPTWHGVIHHAEVGSTQDEALALLRSGTPPGVVVVSDAQRTGRGRLGRPWIDAVRGERGPANLAVTATVPAPGTGLGVVPLAVGLAVAETYRAGGGQPRLKWPNDVLLAGRKAAGILVERHEVAGRSVLLIGCGLNLDWRGIERDAETRHWTSLAEATGEDVDRAQVLADLLGHLGSRLAQVGRDPARIVGEFRGWCATLGEPVRIERPGRPDLHGEAVDLDIDGRLVVRTASAREVVDVGDVVHVRPADGRST
jgi:BirA family transcriptional regulator, biotin operon repressor / biotin---[acetyl-CoA-carboxylase] ligase